MFTVLATLLLAAPPVDPVRPAATATPAPAIEITLNNNGSYTTGSPVRVQIQTRDDGYLIVFRVDGDGQVRVLFPLDPTDDAFVRGNHEYEVRGRGEHQAFLADDLGGNGLVYAAIASQPYAFGDFVTNGHWDYGTIALRDSSTDAEADLSDIVGRMTGGRHFDYDAVGYQVQEIATAEAPVSSDGGYYPGLYDPYYNPSWRCLGCGWGYPGAAFTLGLSFGYSPFYDPWFYSPWGYNYGYYYGGNYWFPGTYPVYVGSRSPRRPAPVERPRPRPEPRGVGGTFAPGGGGAHGAPPPADRGNPSSGHAPSPGTRARPRPSDMSVTPRTSAPQSQRWDRPVFRQPPASSGVPSVDRGRAPVSARPVYREPPRVDRNPAPMARPSAPPPSMRPSSPPPSARPSSPPRSAPPASRPRPSGSGGHGGH